MREYPAEHYALVVAGHGKGPDGLLVDHTGRWMPVEEFAGALRGAGQPLDLVVLQACSMAHHEVVEQLRGAADYLVASPVEINGSAYPHNRLGELTTLSPREAAVALGNARQLADTVPAATAVELANGRVLAFYGSETGLNGHPEVP
jgi:hypothetical protein